MIFHNLILNDSIWEKLYNSFKNKKIPNAYIFFGVDGIGKEAHAIEFAALLNCKRITNKGDACGDCRSCIRIKSFQHEEVHFIRPLPALKNKSSSKELILDPHIIEELNISYKEKIKNPYYKIELKNANIIPINAIRNIKKKLFYTKSDENWTVVIISDAEKLCMRRAEAANSLLKILEEPPDRTLFILLTSKINLLTSTILSRCQKQFFPKLNNSILEKFMSKENSGEAIDKANFQLSHGSISNLLDIISLNRANKLKKIIDCFYSKEIDDIEKNLTMMNEINVKDKKEIFIYLNHLKVSAKDLYALSKNNSKEFLEYEYLHQKYKDILNSCPKGDWSEILNLLDDCLRDLSNNVNFSLSLYSLMINIQYCLKGNKQNAVKPELIKGI